MIPYIVSKRNMSFMTCCWKSCGLGCPQCTSNPRFSLSPMHTDGRATLACVLIFRLLVSPSNRKAEKATLPLIGKQQELPLLSFFGFAHVCRVFAGVLRGVLVAKKVVQWPFRMKTTSSVLCGANLVLPNILTSQVLFEWFELIADICWYPAVPEWWQCKMTQTRLKTWKYVIPILVKIAVCTKNLAI